MIWKPKIIWSYDLKYENSLILWSEIRKHFDLMIWDRKIIWSYDLRSENNLIHDPFGRDHVILISSYFVIAWFWTAYFYDPRFLDHFFCDLVILISKILWSSIFGIMLFGFTTVEILLTFLIQCPYRWYLSFTVTHERFFSVQVHHT